MLNIAGTDQTKQVRQTPRQIIALSPVEDEWIGGTALFRSQEFVPENDFTPNGNIRLPFFRFQQR